MPPRAVATPAPRTFRPWLASALRTGTCWHPRLFYPMEHSPELRARGEGTPLLSAGPPRAGVLRAVTHPQLLSLPLGSEPGVAGGGTPRMSTNLPPMGTGPGSAASASTPAGAARLAPRENPLGRVGGLRQPPASPALMGTCPTPGPPPAPPREQSRAPSLCPVGAGEAETP